MFWGTNGLTAPLTCWGSLHHAHAIFCLWRGPPSAGVVGRVSAWLSIVPTHPWLNIVRRRTCLNVCKGIHCWTFSKLVQFLEDLIPFCSTIPTTMTDPAWRQMQRTMKLWWLASSPVPFWASLPRRRHPLGRIKCWPCHVICFIQDFEQSSTFVVSKMQGLWCSILWSLTSPCD